MFLSFPIELMEISSCLLLLAALLFGLCHKKRSQFWLFCCSLQWGIIMNFDLNKTHSTVLPSKETRLNLAAHRNY